MLNLIYYHVKMCEENGSPMPEMVLMYSNHTLGDVILKVTVTNHPECKKRRVP